MGIDKNGRPTWRYVEEESFLPIIAATIIGLIVAIAFYFSKALSVLFVISGIALFCVVGCRVTKKRRNRP